LRAGKLDGRRYECTRNRIEQRCRRRRWTTFDPHQELRKFVCENKAALARSLSLTFEPLMGDDDDDDR
jgi:hypothetical protein